MEGLKIDSRFKDYISNPDFHSALLMWLQELCPVTLELDELEQMNTQHLKAIILLT